MPAEWSSNQYDEVYATGGTDQIYDLPYRHSGYYPLFKAVARALRAHRARSVLEVGCGTGGFALLWLEGGGGVAYRGFDFSSTAVERAQARTGRPELFKVGDARSPSSYRDDFDAIVCTEVLEHIEQDLEVMSLWPAGTRCVCSVPNFGAENHVRYFQSEDEVRHRYGGLVNIEKVVRVKRPYLNDLSWRSYARELRWNRYRPKRLRMILGLTSFDRAGGWFLFSGTRTTG